MERRPIKAIDNKPIAFLVLISITLCFASLFFLESDTVSQLNNKHVFEELVSDVPGAFKRYLLFLFVSLAAGVAIVAKDREFEQLPGRGAILAAVVLGISLSWISLSRVLQFPVCGDDSYIDFRYIRNWVEGISFDYNPGERVIGFTSHIHLMMLYFLKLIFGGINIDLISQMLNVSFQFLNLGILYFFLKDLFNKYSAALAGIFAYAFDPYGIHETVFGKESHILVFFLILSIWAMHRKRYRAVAWLTSLMPFIRPEAVFWWGLAFIWSLKERGKEGLKAYLIPLALVAVFLGAMYMYFGGVVPHGMLGKFKMYYPNMDGLMFARVMQGIGTSIFIPRYFMIEPEYLVAPFAFLVLSVICGVVTLLLSLKIFSNSILKWYVFALLGYVVVFGVKNPVNFSWYHWWYFLLPVFFLAATVPALLKVMEDKSKGTVKRVSAGLAVCYLVFIQLAQQIVVPVPNLTSFAFRLDPEFKRIVQFGRAYKKIQTYPGYETATIGTPEIGYLGFIHRGKILDFCGLVSPEVLEIGRLPLSCQDKEANEIFEINPASVEKFRPDYIITLEAFGRELAGDPFFQENYKEIARLDNNWLKSKGIYVYRSMASRRKGD